MNILFVSDHYLPTVNGIVKHMVVLKKELEKRGHSVIVVAPKCAPEELGAAGDIIHVPSIPFFLRPQDRLSMPFNKKIENVLLNTNIDIVHSHGVLLGFLGIKTANKKHIPQVVTLHTPFQEYTKWLFPWAAPLTPPLTDWLSQLYFNQYDTVIAPSVKATNSMKKAHVSIPVELIHNGIELDKIQNVSPNLFLDKYKINKKDPLIVLVGRIDRGKNVQLAIKALKKIQKIIPNVKMAIIGDGMMRKNVQSMIKRHKLGKNAFITGFIDHELVMSANKAATLAIMTSDSDILPTVAIEAIACGKCMVAVNDSAITAIVRHGVNGLLVKKKSDKVAAAIIKLIRNSRLRKQYSEASIKIANQFSVEKCVDQLEKLYLELIYKNSNGLLSGKHGFDTVSSKSYSLKALFKPIITTNNANQIKEKEKSQDTWLS